MSMTKKDYENVAMVILSENLPDETRTSLVKKFSDVFASENAHFKHDAFSKACGIYSCAIKDCEFRTTDLSVSKAHIIQHIHNS